MKRKVPKTRLGVARPATSAADQPKPTNLGGLLSHLRAIILESRQQALRSVDVLQVRTCWVIGRHIVEFEQGGAARAAYGHSLLARLAEHLTAEFGKGFDASNLRYMRLFFHAFPNCDALRHELSWTHYRLLLRVEDEAARRWYMNEAGGQNWNTRALERQIGTLYYERLLVSKVRDPIRAEAAEKLTALPGSPREFIRREVLPYTPDAWIDESATKIGYEISFTRHFYQPQPLRTLDVIRADILAVEKEAEGLLDELLKAKT